ncbi:MAG: Hsp70 family protein [Myxococcota bacterium]
MSESFVVGIDLGTTHCAVAAAALAHPSVHQIDVPQLIAPGEVGARALLPSFMYLPAAGELPDHERALPWGSDPTVVGELARRLGAKAPNRLVASAKSWVCHGGVNRRAPILPWSAPDDEPHVSPFDAQVAYLAHLRQAWALRYPNAALTDQDVVVTVPASFDEGARELTSQAAAAAGLGDVRLLEEPQAAFYDFLGAHADDLAEQLGDARLILVVDVGGGTTDLTLLEVQPADGDGGQPKIERIAVGGHLMLGGDNMDAALAVYALDKAGLDRPSDATIWSALVQSARQAKETLLAADAPEQAVISYVGRGSRLVGNTKSIVVERDEANRVLLDGFVPVTGAAETAQRASRAGLTTLGLPYTTDTAIGRHINAFLRKHAEGANQAGAQLVDGLPRPDLLLLNGGVFNAPAIIERLSEVVAGWYGGERIRLLEHTSLETAVARGAVRSGLARRGVGEVIGGGTARAYYVGVEGPDRARQAMCIAPRAMDEGASVSVPDRVYELVLNQPVEFPLYAYTGDRLDAAGDVIAVSEQDDELDPMPAIETVLRPKGGDQSGSTVPVTLTATLTQTGALELYLVTVELPPRRWRLDFALHAPPPPEPAAAPGADEPAPELGQAAEIFAEAYRTEAAKAIKSVRKDIEKVLGPRGQWSAATCRALWQVCMDHQGARGLSELHELNWLRLVGWCLRPGFGADGDEERLAQMWALRDGGLAKRSKATWAEWWIGWRRIAAGLDADRQRSLFEDVRLWLWPPPKPPPGPHAHGKIEMMQMLAALERLPQDDKIEAGALLLERAKKIGSYWPLGRVGSRTLFHGDSDDAVGPDVATEWLDRLLELDWDSAEGAAFAAASIARLTGDPRRDVDAAVRKRVAERLRKAKVPASWVDMVVRPSDLSAADVKRMFGDSLPAGLRLT